MAGIATHLAIAREMINLLPEGIIKDEGMFYAGSVAPDAIHARDGFVRADKKHTHLRDDILDRDFIQEEYLTLFHQRVAKFIMEHRERTGSLLDLYRGYVTHLLTDELFILTIREEFCKTMKSMGIEQSHKDFFCHIITDMNRNDFLVVSYNQEMDEIKIKLEQVVSYQIEGLLSEYELETSRNWLLHRYFYDEYELLEPVYIRYKRTLEFIKMAAEDIVKRLSEGGSLPRMF